MITFRSIFDKLVEELKPNKGHMSGVDNFINVGDIVNWNSVDRVKFKEFLDGSEIVYEPSEDPYNIYRSIKSGAPEAFYWLWKHKPGKKLKALISKDGYTLYVFSSYAGSYIKHVFIDDANGQILGMISADVNTDTRLKDYFGIAPWQVHLSQTIPSMRGSGEGKVMYSMFLEARKAIISDSTLYEGSFAMWDTQIRSIAKYSGVITDWDGFPIVNKDTSVYDMAIPNDMLGNFFASNTIAPWIIKYSNKLNSLNVKECFYVQITTNKYHEQSFLEVLDSLASEADAKLIVAALKGEVHGKRRGKLDPEVNKFIRLADEDWSYESWSQPGRLTNAKHIIVALGTEGMYDPPIAIYDIDLTLPEPEVSIL